MKTVLGFILTFFFFLSNNYAQNTLLSKNIGDKNNETESIECVNIKTKEDAAIGYHDFFNTGITNFGNAIQNAAYVVPGSLGGLNVNRALLYFNLSSIPSSSSIVSAKINLYALGPIGLVSGHEGNNESILQRVVQPWNEFLVTWVNQPQTTNNNEVKLSKSTSPTQDYINIDVLPLIKDIASNNNYGMMLKLKEEELNNVLIFHSSDFFNVEKHPSLDICYTKNMDTTIVSTYKEILKCKDQEIILESNLNSNWSSGETGASISIKANGYYIATSFYNDTMFIDSFYIKQIQVPTLELGEDIKLCKFIPFILNVNDKFDTYLWSNGSTLNEIKINFPGEYWVQTIDQCKNISVDTIKISDLSSDTTRILKYMIPGEKIIIGNNQYVQTGNYIINLLNKYECDSIIVIDIKSANAVVVHDFNKCIAVMGSTNMDYSEFLPEYKSQLECSDITASIVYRDGAVSNKHSCTPGINNSLAMCIEPLNLCEYKAGHEKSIKVNVTFDPKGNNILQFQGLSFYAKAPDMFDWINGSKGLNNYPTKYGVRILRNGSEIFSKSDISSSQVWVKEILNFSENNQFTFTEKTILSIEILPYCLVGNGANVSVWDIDDLNIFTTCMSKASIIAEGKIETTTGKTLPQTTILLKDLSSEIKTTTTDRNGRYIFNIPNLNQEIFIEPNNDDNHLEGVSTLDLILIQRHILGIKVFTTPEQIIAADIDNNKKLTSSDILELRKNILGIKRGFKNNKSWRFNQNTFEIQFANPFHFKEYLKFKYFSTDKKELNFTGIKIGDVSSTEYTMNSEFRNSNSFNMVQRLNCKNGIYYLDLYGSEISNVLGLEVHFELGNYVFDELISGKVKITEEDFSFSKSKVLISKIFEKAQSFEKNDLLFSIKLKSKPKFNDLSDGKETIFGEVYLGEDIQILPIKIEKMLSDTDNNLNKIKVFPNPFAKLIEVNVKVEKPTLIRLFIFDNSGKMVLEEVYNIDKSNNSIYLSHSFFQDKPGLYFVKVISENLNQVIKIISI